MSSTYTHYMKSALDDLALQLVERVGEDPGQCIVEYVRQCKCDDFVKGYAAMHYAEEVGLIDLYRVKGVRGYRCFPRE